MAEYVLTATKNHARAGSFYDRIEGFYDLTFKLNGYGRSLDQYFEAHPLPVFPAASVLEAGCGTGTLTLALLRTLKVPVKLTALDLSASSMATKKYVDKKQPERAAGSIRAGQRSGFAVCGRSFRSGCDQRSVGVSAARRRFE